MLVLLAAMALTAHAAQGEYVGELTKSSPDHFFQRLCASNRHFIIQDRKLAWYKDAEGTDKKGEIDLDNVTGFHITQNGESIQINLTAHEEQQTKKYCLESSTNRAGITSIQLFYQKHQEALPEVQVVVDMEDDADEGHITVTINNPSGNHYTCRYKLSLVAESVFQRASFGLFQLRRCKGETKGELPANFGEKVSMGTKIREELFKACRGDAGIEFPGNHALCVNWGFLTPNDFVAMRQLNPSA